MIFYFAPNFIIPFSIFYRLPEIQGFKADLQHYVFNNLSDQVLTNDKYSSLLAQKDFKEGVRFSLFKLLIKPGVKFFETFILKVGFLDGLPGFLIAISAAYSIFLRQAKLWELETIKK